MFDDDDDDDVLVDVDVDVVVVVDVDVDVVVVVVANLVERGEVVFVFHLNTMVSKFDQGLGDLNLFTLSCQDGKCDDVAVK